MGIIKTVAKEIGYPILNKLGEMTITTASCGIVILSVYLLKEAIIAPIHKKQIETQQRNVISHIESIVTNEHFVVNNEFIRINANGTNYDFYLKYKPMPKTKPQKILFDYSKTF